MPDLSEFNVVPNAKGLAELRLDLAFGLHAVAMDGETESKREAPVHGGYRSFRPGAKPIGGTLRRSVHSATFVGGQQIAVHRETDRALPKDETPSGGGKVIESFIGTNCGYGAFVHLGTARMPARFFLDLWSARGRAIGTMSAAIARRRRRIST